MNRKQQIKEINMVLDYSRKVYGSCTHSYIGCLADTHLRSLLGGETNIQGVHEKGYDELFKEATDEQMDEAHEFVNHWIPIARDYLAVKSRLARAFAQFA